MHDGPLKMFSWRDGGVGGGGSIWGSPLMGEQWSAVTPNEAKENTSALSHLIDLSAGFSFFTARLSDLQHGRTEPNEPHGLG